MPSDSETLDYGGELALVTGSAVRRAFENEARIAIAYYVVVNEVFVREWQSETPQTWLGKSFDTDNAVVNSSLQVVSLLNIGGRRFL